MAKLFANSVDPDQKPRSALFGSLIRSPGLHCLPITLVRVSRLQWVSRSYCTLLLLNIFFNVIGLDVFVGDQTEHCIELLHTYAIEYFLT